MIKHNIMKYFIPISLLVLCLILPLNFYIIGGDIGIGVQGAFYRYQVTGYGSGLIPLNQDIGYVLNETYDGKTAISVEVWAIAAFFLAAATVMSLITDIKLIEKRAYIVCILTFFGSVGFLGSVMIQYGVLFNGPAGISIPIGVLPLFILSVYGYKMRNTFF